MRTAFAAVLTFALTLPSAVAGQVILRPHDPVAAERAVESSGAALGVLESKIDEPASLLFVPFYEVDTDSASGTTTLFAVRNITAAPLDLDVRYRAPDGTVLRQDLVSLAARETLSRNVRDVAGLPADPDGFARGFVMVQVDAPPGTMVVGDYLQVDVGDDFATGDRMVSLADLCDLAEVRFFDFGAGTELRILVNVPRGTEPGDPPTFTVTPYGEDGATFPATDVFVDTFTVRLDAADFTGLAFGTLVFNFSPASGGLVYAEYSADGRFSVGMNGACVTP